jgi:polysaccharide biosynthesis/export protein
MRRLGIYNLLLVSLSLCCSTARAQSALPAAPVELSASNLGSRASLSLIASSALAERTAARTDDDTTRPALRQRDPRYRLCSSDVIALTFAKTPEFDQTVNVQPDGFISLAGVADVHVEGMTTAEAGAAIKTAYGKVLENPELSIELKDFNKPYFMVNGQVFKPGKFDLRGYTTASQAITMAGGFEDSAKHSQVLLFRRVNDSWYEVKKLDMKHILQGHDVDEDPEIRPGDLLFVPQNTISKVKKFIPNYGMGAYAQFNTF